MEEENEKDTEVEIGAEEEGEILMGFYKLSVDQHET